MWAVRGGRPPSLGRIARCIIAARFNSSSVEGTGALVPIPKAPIGAHPTLPLDTWHWVQTLSGTPLTLAQSEALLRVSTLLLHHRLQAHLHQLTSHPHLRISTTHLSALLHDLSCHHAASLGSVEVASRRRVERLTAELCQLEGLREGMGGVRTDLVLDVNGFRAEGREEGQRLEMELHKEEGRLAANMSSLRSDGENVKVRSIYSFAVVILSILVIAVAERSSSKNRKKRDAPSDVHLGEL